MTMLTEILCSFPSLSCCRKPTAGSTLDNPISWGSQQHQSSWNVMEGAKGLGRCSH